MTRTRRSNRSLTLEQIIDASLEIIDEHGIDAVTIRAVAERLGVGAMTLYTYVGTKEGLMASIAGRFLEELAMPDPAVATWQEEVAAVFRAVHEVFLEHPELGRITASQPVDSIAAYRGAEAVLAALRRAGLANEDAVTAFDALSSYTIGSTQREASRRTTHIPPADRLAEIRRLPADDFPHVREMARLLVARDASRDFDHGLRLLIDGIEQGIAHARA
jgi:AcrR family transcriptional regulator